MTDQEIRNLLTTSKTIAVVGLSANPARPSFGVTRFLIEHGYEIFGVNPGHDSILNRPCVATLEEVPVNVDIVDVFRNSEAVPEIIENAIKIKAKAVWLQEGVSHSEAETKAAATGLLVVSNRCILKEHRRLID